MNVALGYRAFHGLVDGIIGLVFLGHSKVCRGRVNYKVREAYRIVNYKSPVFLFVCFVFVFVFVFVFCF